MKKSMILLIALTLYVLSSCSKPVENSTIITNQDKIGRQITINMIRGENWSHKQKLFGMNLTITPQIAIWVEDTNGNFIDTLYVTKAFGKQKWLFVKYDPDKPLRTMCMPYWLGKRSASGLPVPTKNNPLADSVTTATPKGDFTVKTTIPAGLTECVILAEFNKSFDPNENFMTGAEFEVNGQPSVVYAAKLDLASGQAAVTMDLVGYGGNTGEDTSLYTDTTKLTTVTSITDSIKIELN